MRVVALQGSEVDAALRVRGKAGAGLASEAIGPVVATPVCSPELAQGIQSPADLSRQTLIEMRGGAEGSWTVAMQRLGVTEAPQLLALESYFETLTAAERGLGVAFGLFPMTTNWVRQGRLAVPFPTRTPVEGGVYLVFRGADPRRGLLVEIAGWLREQYAELETLRDGRVITARAPREAG